MLDSASLSTRRGGGGGEEEEEEGTESPRGGKWTRSASKVRRAWQQGTDGSLLPIARLAQWFLSSGVSLQPPTFGLRAP